MIKLFQFVKNIMLLNRRKAADKITQSKEGYSIEMNGSGPETYITYIENNLEIDVAANFTMFNDVILYTDSLRKWSRPKSEVLTPFDYQKVLNRVIRYLSCWGEVEIDESRLPDNDDLKRSLTEQGIPFTELENGVITYSVNADILHREAKKK